MRVLVAVRDKDLIGGKTLCYLGLYKIETFEGVRPAEHGFLVFRCKMKRCDTEPLPPDRKSTRLNSSHLKLSRMPSSA